MCAQVVREGLCTYMHGVMHGCMYVHFFVSFLSARAFARGTVLRSSSMKLKDRFKNRKRWNPRGSDGGIAYQTRYVSPSRYLPFYIPLYLSRTSLSVSLRYRYLIIRSLFLKKRSPSLTHTQQKLLACLVCFLRLARSLRLLHRLSRPVSFSL